MSAISIRNLSKTYPVPFQRLRAFFRRPAKDAVEALRDVSFEVETGEIFGLIGRNGAGKTTLLKMLNGLIKPDGGRIELHGRVGALIALGAGFNPAISRQYMTRDCLVAE